MPTSRPVQRPIVDRPPYICDFIPREGVAELSGLSGKPRQSGTKGGPLAHDHGSCTVWADKLVAVGVSTLRSPADDQLDRSLGPWNVDPDKTPAPLPSHLGRGGIADTIFDTQDLRTVVAMFRCGKRDRMIKIDINKHSGRAQDPDLIQLMEIAQRRFAEHNKCELGGPSPTVSPTGS